MLIKIIKSILFICIVILYKISKAETNYHINKSIIKQNITYLIGQDDEGAGCDGSPIGCICVTGGNNKHKYLNNDYTGCDSKDGLDMGSELRCVMATRGCESCTPYIKPYKFISLKSCKKEAKRRGYDLNNVLILNINQKY